MKPKTLVMIKALERLSPEEQALLYKAPVWISALVSSAYGEVNQTQKNDAIRLAHLRTFTAPPLLQPYYREVDHLFKEAFEETLKEYYPFDPEKRAQLQQQLSRVQAVVDKLERGYAQALAQSLDSYARHVKRSTYSVFRDFIFPITYSKLDEL